MEEDGGRERGGGKEWNGRRRKVNEGRKGRRCKVGRGQEEEGRWRKQIKRGRGG